MAHSTNTHIAQLRKSLEAAEAHIRLLKDERNITRDKEVLLEQLARAYGQLQSIYATYSNPAKYSFSFGEVGAWVNSVENAVGNDIYKVVLDWSYQLDGVKYVIKDRDPSVADRGWTGHLPPVYVLSKAARNELSEDVQEDEPSSGSTIIASKQSIAIVGSGWAGFTLAHALSLAKYDVAVISPTRTIQYTPLLASAAAGMFNFRLAEEPVRRRNRLPGLNYHKATVDTIDFDNRQLNCKPSVTDMAGQHLQAGHDFTLQYDKLVLAPGCNVQTFGTLGALEHTTFLRTTDNARKIQQRVLEMLDAASMPGLDDAQQRDILRIIIAGGGAIGIEATAELFDLWHHDLRHLYPHLDGKLSIEIHDIAPALLILGSFDKRLGEYALHKLEGRGIKIETESHIEKVEPGAL
ncbi:Putative FAD/NAD(P)-binding domain, FAD/NAD(P)-binding domain superfamily [Septoria linicola]|uniref:FAD/NAD(P)-binding domain, FAD/NAD(P)-binding domain superfamily n=1 Tax=Septoria linicola TaxID=215465 RepID=A0A9Q9AZF3_9PEZI|nr:Putative FAD/NAD(P)-binding domain, FAD/NAD(P)-binding domain superfamily [Septoria linicola]